MNDTVERVPLECPACSPDLETVHEVLKPGGQATVRCTECSHVHKTALPEEQTRQIDVVVSQEDESFSAKADVPADETHSFDLQVPGDYEFVVGETEELGGEEFTVEGVLVRDDAMGYDHEKLDFDGDTVVAKDIKRLYARDESTSAWSAW